MTTRQRVLVVEDDPKTAKWLVLYLERAGMDVSVVTDGRAALAAADAEPPDLVLLDLMLPLVDGFAVCRALRAASRVPVIIVTARASEDDRLRGFELGADDYITKPFSPREVVARVRAVLRRSRTEDAAPPVLRCGALTLRTDTLVVDDGRTTVKLTPVESRLLGAMFAAPRRVWTRAQLMSRVFGDDYEGSERTVDVHVKNLRRKLETLGTTALLIETTHGVGYRLNA